MHCDACRVDHPYIVYIVCNWQLALLSRGSGRARGIWVGLAVGGLSHPRKNSIHYTFIYICIYVYNYVN